MLSKAARFFGRGSAACGSPLRVVSFPHAGDYLLLKCLAGHPSIEAVPAGQDDPALGTEGIVLVRNPVSLFASIFIGNRILSKAHDPRAALLATAPEINPELAAELEPWNDVEAFAALYNRRMTALIRSGMPVIRFEDFSACPGKFLRRLLENRGLIWDPAVLQPHRAHFGDSSPLPWNFYDGNLHTPLSRATEARLADLCAAVMAELGYSIVKGELILEHRKCLFR